MVRNGEARPTRSPCVTDVVLVPVMLVNLLLVLC